MVHGNPRAGGPPKGNGNRSVTFSEPGKPAGPSSFWKVRRDSAAAPANTQAEQPQAGDGQQNADQHCTDEDAHTAVSSPCHLARRHAELAVGVSIRLGSGTMLARLRRERLQAAGSTYTMWHSSGPRAHA